MTTVPPYLKKGDTIAIVCPSGYMPAEKAAACIDTLQQWGYQVKTGKTLGSQFHYFSGTDPERLADLQDMLDDQEVKAVLCGRGGYGLSRIIDQLDFTKFRKHPKWLIGFSDITLLHAHVYERFHIACLHSPMAAAFNDGEHANMFVQSLRRALKGESAKYACNTHPLNRAGRAEGKLTGGNLSLLVHAIGSRSSVKTKNRILFLEDVSEYLYHIDRMMIQLKRAGMLEELAGLIIGGFTDMKDTTIPFGSDVYSLIASHVEEYDYPVCFDFPVSHEKNNYALKIGISHTLQVTKNKTTLTEGG
ncbi:S66 peptidase family protein [Sediminibacterium soli]|uniref:S66 peptidase family protein n=1 Tax=Sediminibacterium soli TaxID=2698829 RepID=UPI00137A5B09|nr:LD-carboxypeptidase [Sediminibacterium soli]NCI47305.1 LD-carboxypeptidase [Sediminibacterium soli]